MMTASPLDRGQALPAASPASIIEFLFFPAVYADPQWLAPWLDPLGMTASDLRASRGRTRLVSRRMLQRFALTSARVPAFQDPLHRLALQARETIVRCIRAAVVLADVRTVRPILPADRLRAIADLWGMECLEVAARVPEASCRTLISNDELDGTEFSTRRIQGFERDCFVLWLASLPTELAIRASFRFPAATCTTLCTTKRPTLLAALAMVICEWETMMSSRDTAR